MGVAGIEPLAPVPLASPEPLEPFAPFAAPAPTVAGTAGTSSVSSSRVSAVGTNSRSRAAATPSPFSSPSACSSSSVSSGAWSVSSTRLSATRLGTRMSRRFATSFKRRSRMLWTPAASPPGRNSRMIKSPNPVKTSWYLGYE